jgi:hypothetical protein
MDDQWPVLCVKLRPYSGIPGGTTFSLVNPTLEYVRSETNSKMWYIRGLHVETGEIVMFPAGLVLGLTEGP